MNIPASLQLQDDRCLLRLMCTDDLTWMAPYGEQYPELWPYSITAKAGKENMEAYLELALTNYRRGESFPFVIWDKQQGQFAGSTRFYDIQETHGTLQLGYTWIDPALQRSGLNRHCKWLLLNYAFENLGVERVEFRADINNHRSIKAMKSIGCTEEGILRSHLSRADGGRRTSIVLSILRTEWQTHVRSHLLGLLKKQKPS